MTASAIILFLMCVTAHGAQGKSVHVGIVVEVSMLELTLEHGNSHTSIGFVGDAEALRTLKKIKIGEEVRAVFGTREKPNGMLVNKFLSIRVCHKNDDECAADRKRQEDESLLARNKSDLIEQERALCQKKMDEVLAKDGRYVQKTSDSNSAVDLAKYNALSGDQRVCAQAISRQHLAAYSEACEKLHCYDNVGGGCSHMTGYALNSTVFEKALEKCGSPSTLSQRTNER
jgi:hypothetical protein